MDLKNHKDKGSIFKKYSEKKERLLQRISLRLIANFSTAIMEATRQWRAIFKVLTKE